MTWFYEDENDELRYGYAITTELARVKSDYQDLRVVNSKAYGKMLLIDDVVMISEGDEFVYREMLSHVPVGNHRAPRQLLVAGRRIAACRPVRPPHRAPRRHRKP